VLRDLTAAKLRLSVKFNQTNPPLFSTNSADYLHFIVPTNILAPPPLHFQRISASGLATSAATETRPIAGKIRCLIGKFIRLIGKIIRLIGSGETNAFYKQSLPRSSST
jgi:hypothetical protein